MPIYRHPVRIVDSRLGGEGANVWHIRTGGGIGEGLTIERASEWLREFYDEIKGQFPSGCEIRFEGVATEVAVEDPALMEGLTTWTVTGTGGGTALPPANALCISWRTASATRAGRGRTFLGPLALGLTDADGTPSSAALTALRSAIDTLVGKSTGPDADGAAVAVYSPTQNLARDITSGTVRDQYAVLRSRRD